MLVVVLAAAACGSGASAGPRDAITEVLDLDRVTYSMTQLGEHTADLSLDRRDRVAWLDIDPGLLGGRSIPGPHVIETDGKVYVRSDLLPPDHRAALPWTIFAVGNGELTPSTIMLAEKGDVAVPLPLETYWRDDDLLRAAAGRPLRGPAGGGCTGDFTLPGSSQPNDPEVRRVTFDDACRLTSFTVFADVEVGPVRNPDEALGTSAVVRDVGPTPAIPTDAAYPPVRGA
jgi:hypothetical protein